MPSVYDLFAGGDLEAAQAEAMASALSRNRDLGTLAMLSGDRVLAPLGKGLMGTAGDQEALLARAGQQSGQSKLQRALEAERLKATTQRDATQHGYDLEKLDRSKAADMERLQLTEGGSNSRLGRSLAAQRALEEMRINAGKYEHDQQMTAGQAERLALAREKMGRLSDKQVDSITDIDKAIDTTKAILSQKDKFDTGPIAGRANAVAGFFGVDNPEKSAFRSQVQRDLSDYLHKLSGAAITANEEVRLRAGIPTMNDDDSTFKAKAGSVLDELKRVRGRTVTNLGKVGKDVSQFTEPTALPGIVESAPASGGWDDSREAELAEKKARLAKLRGGGP